MQQQSQQQWQQRQQQESQTIAQTLLRSGKPALTLDAAFPQIEAAQEVATESIRDQSTQGVSYRREQDGTPHVKVQLHASSVSQFRNRFNRFLDSVEQSYQAAGITGQQ